MPRGGSVGTKGSDESEGVRMSMVGAEVVRLVPIASSDGRFMAVAVDVSGSGAGAEDLEPIRNNNPMPPFLGGAAGREVDDDDDDGGVGAEEAVLVLVSEGAVTTAAAALDGDISILLYLLMMNEVPSRPLLLGRWSRE
jgi:hypothetical protein